MAMDPARWEEGEGGGGGGGAFKLTRSFTTTVLEPLETITFNPCPLSLSQSQDLALAVTRYSDCMWSLLTRHAVVNLHLVHEFPRHDVSNCQAIAKKNAGTFWGKKLETWGRSFYPAYPSR